MLFCPFGRIWKGCCDLREVNCLAALCELRMHRPELFAYEHRISYRQYLVCIKIVGVPNTFSQNCMCIFRKKFLNNAIIAAYLLTYLLISAGVQVMFLQQVQRKSKIRRKSCWHKFFILALHFHITATFLTFYLKKTYGNTLPLLLHYTIIQISQYRCELLSKNTFSYNF